MGIDPVTLRTVIHDDAAFGVWADAGEDPAASVLERLLRHDPNGAQVALDVCGTALPDWRRDALQAEIWRDQRRYDLAVAAYRRLLDAGGSAARIAMLTQHLGKVYFAAGHYGPALDCFARALELRARQTPAAPPDQLESSRMALRRTEQLLAGGAVSR